MDAVLLCGSCEHYEQLTSNPLTGTIVSWLRVRDARGCHLGKINLLVTTKYVSIIIFTTGLC